MPASSIVVNGVLTRRPGVYSVIDTSSLAGAGAQARGVVALVGSFERLEPKKPTAFETAAALKRALPDSGALLASLLFAPARDSRIPAGAQKVVISRVDPASKASLTLSDGVKASVILRSLDWGSYANRINVKVEAGTVAGKKLTTNLDGVSAVHDNIGGTKIFTARYTEAEATTMQIRITPLDPTVVVAIDYTKTLIAGVYNPIKMAFDGTISFALAGGVSPPAPNETTFTILGVAKDGSTSEVVTIPAGGAGPVTSAKQWASVTSITPANLGGMTYSIIGFAFLLAKATYDTVQKCVDRINAFSGQGFVASVVTTLNPRTYLVTNLDALTPTNIKAPAAANGPNGDVYAWVTVVTRDSAVVTAERAVGADTGPANLVLTYLAGGADGTAVASDWQSAIDALKSEFVNIVVPVSDDAAYHEKVRAHVVYMAGMGRDERNAYVGAPTGTTFTDLQSKIAALNERNMSLVGQEIQIYAPDGTATWYSPVYAAIMAAGMQAGRPVGTPLTWKYPNVLDFRQNSSWNPVDNAEAAIAAGLMFLRRDHVGILWERDVTTYLQADNPIFTAMSANESANESTKDLRRYLEQEIGNPNVPGTTKTIYGLASARLDRQVNQQDLALAKAWRNLEVEDLGDGFDVGYEVAPIEGTTFIRQTARVVRIPT